MTGNEDTEYVDEHTRSGRVGRKAGQKRTGRCLPLQPTWGAPDWSYGRFNGRSINAHSFSLSGRPLSGYFSRLAWTRTRTRSQSQSRSPNHLLLTLQPPWRRGGNGQRVCEVPPSPEPDFFYVLICFVVVRFPVFFPIFFCNTMNMTIQTIALRFPAIRKRLGNCWDFKVMRSGASGSLGSA